VDFDAAVVVNEAQFSKSVETHAEPGDIAVGGDAEASQFRRLTDSCKRTSTVVLAATATSFREQSIAERFLMKVEDNIGIREIGLALLPLEL
jgi:hypothetical protein